jgi:hypothetical protein
MRLVVIGAYSLDVLQDHVVTSFSDIRAPPQQQPLVGTSNNNNNNAGSSSWDGYFDSPLKSVGMPVRNFGRIYYFAPVRDRHSLSVTWQLPCQFGNWKSKPCDFLAHLIGHEAKGSLLASLKAKSWVTACCAGVGAEGYEVCVYKGLYLLFWGIGSHLCLPKHLIPCRMPRRMPCSRFPFPSPRKGLPTGQRSYPSCTNTLACCDTIVNKDYRNGSTRNCDPFKRLLIDTVTKNRPKNWSR